MKRTPSILPVALLAALLLLLGARAALAEEVKLVGVITKIELAADGKSATIALKDNKTEQTVQVLVSDDLTLDKFKDHRIVEGDEIRLKYEVQAGKNLSRYFRKTAGC
ncbi:MAG: hypothetical protein HY900_08020 [Deltaproteobacteria bacterium]|nr:hypothetical protein [Deltaproteobacteria bacterium]